MKDRAGEFPYGCPVPSCAGIIGLDRDGHATLPCGVCGHDITVCQKCARTINRHKRGEPVVVDGLRYCNEQCATNGTGSFIDRWEKQQGGDE